MVLSVEQETPLGLDSDWHIRGIVTTILPLLLVLSVVVMGAGYVLEGMAETFLENPTLFVLIPVMIDTGGNIGTILSTRLSTRLHLGDIELRPRDPVIAANVTAVLFLSMTMFTILAIAAYGIGAFFGDPLGLGVLLVVSVGSGFGITVVSIIVSIAATYSAVKRGIDPDDVVVPLVTSLCDVFGIAIFTAVVIIVI